LACLFVGFPEFMKDRGIDYHGLSSRQGEGAIAAVAAAAAPRELPDWRCCQKRPEEVTLVMPFVIVLLSEVQASA
jgi:hypothetical protein